MEFQQLESSTGWGSDLHGKLCQLHSKETPLLQKCCCTWVSTPAEEDV